MKKSTYTVAVVGATGVVGAEMIQVLEARRFPVGHLRLFASARSLGEALEWRGEEVPIEVLGDDAFAGVDLALFSAGAAVSREYAPIAAAAGACVIDNSSAFRAEPDIPLVVPEVNAATLASWRTRGIIANPNCAAIQICVALAPLHRQFGLRQVVASTYQSVSGAGRKAMEEMTTQVRALFAGEDVQAKILPQVIAFNCVPQIDQFMDSGYTKEEWKIITESQRMLGGAPFTMTATAVRVPVYVGHAVSLAVELQQPADRAMLHDCWRTAPGVVVEDDPAQQRYPMQRRAAGQDAVFVGRVRAGHPHPTSVSLWVAADNLRKGAALNAVQIAEEIIHRYAD